VAANPAARSPFLPNRYGEWKEIRHLTRDLDLSGKKVLDIGAGLGFDSHRLSLRGAEVTALEFSPVLAEAGRLNFPGIRWIGGFSHCLPFRDAAFDAVFCNAALHHMRDVPAAISEALRVLRVGGVLVTTCDSFRASDSGEETELAVFDRDPAVLMGVNEQIPRFSSYVASLQAHPGAVDVELYTHTLYDAPGGGTLAEITRWDLSRDAGMLSRRSGSLAMRVRLLEPWPGSARVQRSVAVRPLEYASWLDSDSAAVARLSALLPDAFVDLPFPGERGSRFELLNGWRLRESGSPERRAYRRGRWFLRRPGSADSLAFTVALPANGSAAQDAVEVLRDGVACGEHAVFRDRASRVGVDVSDLDPGRVFALEIRRRSPGESLEDGGLVVRDRGFIVSRSIASVPVPAGAGAPGVHAVIPVFNRLQFTRDCIRFLAAQTYPSIRIVVSDGGSTDGTVDAIREEHPEVTVLAPRRELWWTGAMAAGIDEVLRTSANAGDFLLMMNNDTEIPPDFVSVLVRASRLHDAAVGALIVDSRDPSRILDAGEYIDWESYAFPVRDRLDEGETYRGDVDVLPGRGSLVPLAMIRAAGNVDEEMLPHYLADYEFFTRLKRHGFRLGVCYETRLMAHIGETGIVPRAGHGSFAAIWRELFSRRSMSNVVDHWRFVGRHAPRGRRDRIRAGLAWRVVTHLCLRTPARWVFKPVFWVLAVPGIAREVVEGQRRVFRQFREDVAKYGADVLCFPERIPRAIRLAAYYLACPGPFGRDDCPAGGPSPEELAARGLARTLPEEGWYAFNTLGVEGAAAGILCRVRSPLRKFSRPRPWRNPSKTQART